MGESARYHLRYPSRCLASVLADKENNRFLVGTQSVREENEVHLLHFNFDTNELECAQVYPHPHEVWSLVASPVDPAIFFTCHQAQGGTRTTSLWRMGDCSSGAQPVLSELFELPVLSAAESVQSALWEPTSGSSALTVHATSLGLWSVENGALVGSGRPTAAASGAPKFLAAAWDPHHISQVATTSEAADITVWDTRSMKASITVEGAHAHAVRTIDYNPNRQYVVATGGDDRQLKLWDLRAHKAPLAAHVPHSHWIWAARYNPQYDQIIITASSDCNVALCNIPSCASNTASGDETPGAKAAAEKAHAAVSVGPNFSTDGIVHRFEEHEDSVYEVVWAANDCWIFASLSFDGGVVLSHVPQGLKYTILL